MLESVHALLDRTEQSLKAQLAERNDILDTYLDSLDPQDRHDLQNELSSILGIPMRLSASQQRALLEDPRGQKPWLQDSLRTNLTTLHLRRLLLTLERRFNESWPLKAADLASQPWKEIRSQVLEQIQGTMERRKQRLLGTDGDIARDLAANEEHLTAALTDENERLRLVQLTTQGVRITFDPKSHRRQLTTAPRLTYVFSMAQQLEALPAQQVTEQVLAHLEEAQAVFQTIFGHAEWEHLRNQEVTLDKLAPNSKDILAEAVGKEHFELLESLPLDEISSEDQEPLVQALGELAQNRIYRQLLLATITQSWVEYLTRMEALRVSISMESYAQRDPLVQYKSQASTMFTELLSEVRQTVISKMYRFRPSLPAEYTTGLRSAASPQLEPALVGAGGARVNDPPNKTRKKRKRH